MKRDLETVVKKVMDFFGKSFNQSEIDMLCNHLSFHSMQNNPSCNKDGMLTFVKNKMQEDEKPKDENFKFIRKGKIGSHKDELTEDQIKKLEKFITRDVLEYFQSL